MSAITYKSTRLCDGNEHTTQIVTYIKNGWMMIARECVSCGNLFDEKEMVKVDDDKPPQKTYSGTVEKNGMRYVITYLLTDTEYSSFMSLGLIPANTTEVLGHSVVSDDVVEAVATMGMSERERIEKAGGATQ
jgi:hypothetical protein